MNDLESTRQTVQSPAPFSTWLGVVLLFLIFGVIVLAVIGPAPRGDNYEQTRAKNREKKLKALREENEKTLTTYGWMDKDKGVVRIPISRAVELTVAELAKKKPEPAYPIATPPPQPSATAAAAPAASPSSSPKVAATSSPLPPPAVKPPVSPPPAAPPKAPASAAPIPSPSPAVSAQPAPAKTP